MAIHYSLKYQKSNIFNKILIEKEGEIIIGRNYFRLKGKGGRDHGEAIYFTDINEIEIINDDTVAFSTFRRIKYRLTNFTSFFSSFLKDFFRIRNEFLAGALLMKAGMLHKEYDGHVEIVDDTGTTKTLGIARIQFYEGSIVIIPEFQECFGIFFNFLKGHEFDQDEYVLRLFLEDGRTLQISKFGAQFEEAREMLESLLSRMYERIVNNLKNILPEFHTNELVKLAYLMRDGKLVSFSYIKKIEENLPQKIETLAFENTAIMRKKMDFLRSQNPVHQFYIGLSSSLEHDSKTTIVKSWCFCAIPDQNLIAVGVCSKPDENIVYFFRIAVEENQRESKITEKIMDFNQTMLLLKYDLGPIYKDKYDLFKSRFGSILKKLIYIRRCRASYIGKSASTDLDVFKKELVNFYSRAMTFYKKTTVVSGHIQTPQTKP